MTAITVMLIQLEPTFAQGASFTYQGRLNDAGQAANGSYNLAFTLFSTNNSGSPIGSTITNNAVGVTNGLFTIALDFGTGIFTGTNLWLQISVETNGGSSFTTLSPRQKLTPTPYSIFANTASDLSGTLPTAQLSGTLPATQLSGTLPSSALSGTYSSAVNFNNAANTFKGDGSGLSGITVVGTPTNHYLCAYATTTQTALGYFTTIAFNNVVVASGWTIGSGGYAFTAPATGLYLVQYQAQVTTSSSSFTMSMRATLNSSTEISGSQAAATIASSGQSMVISKMFLLQVSAGDTVSLQFAGSSSGFGSIAPAGQGTVKPTANLTITQIK
jgi:hypothetical protein